MPGPSCAQHFCTQCWTNHHFMQEHKCSKLSLTEEGAQYAENGMPEAQILHRVAQAGAAGIPQDELQVIRT